MELHLFKPLWGHRGSFRHACEQAVAAGFHGIEGPAPLAPESVDWQQLLADSQLHYIAEICTAGSYVPDRSASLLEHIDSLRKKIELSLPLSPRFVTCLGGCDAWEESKSIEFFATAMELANSYGIDICFETHRGRSFFNPWSTLRICQQLPDLQLTTDLSHWCVVCERLMDVEQDTLDQLAPRVKHIHARVGYDQGPQVPDPRAERYQSALQSHQRWWHQVWRSQHQRGFDCSTMTPEFGVDGYQQIDAVSDLPVGDLWEINCWIANTQLQQFNQQFGTTPAPSTGTE